MHSYLVPLFVRVLIPDVEVLDLPFLACLHYQAGKCQATSLNFLTSCVS